MAARGKCCESVDTILFVFVQERDLRCKCCCQWVLNSSNEGCLNGQDAGKTGNAGNIWENIPHLGQAPSLPRLPEGEEVQNMFA